MMLQATFLTKNMQEYSSCVENVFAMTQGNGDGTT